MSKRKTASVLEALYEALRMVDTAPGDVATTALAKRYASAIDANPEALAEFGPKLLDCLRELGMTPRVRAAVAKGDSQGDRGRGQSKRDELRARREQRATGAD